MPKPICIPCKRFFRPLKTGTTVLEGKPLHPDTRPGRSQEDQWLPYKLWMADSWVCQGCGTEIITGFGRNPIAADYQPNFDKAIEHVDHTVNDC